MTDNMMFVLGLINKKPNNAYELIKELDKYSDVGYKMMPESTVYVILKSFCNKGFIIGNTVKEGNFPAKTIYNITYNGKIELEKAIKNSIIDIDLSSSNFAIAILFFDIFSNEELRVLLNIREETLQSQLNKVSKYNDDLNILAISLLESQITLLKSLYKKLNL